MIDRDIIKLRNKISYRAVAKIISYSLCIYILILLFIDGLLNDEIAEYVNDVNPFLYEFFVLNKIETLATIGILVVAIVSFYVIKKSNNIMINIISAIESILKNPEDDIFLDEGLEIVENKLNKIRVDLITNESAAKEAENKKNDLIMYIAHDLKTPLTSTIGYLTLLIQEKEISKPLQEKYMQIALDKAIRVEELTNQFFEVTRYDLHDMPITKKKIDISLLLSQLLEECYPMLQDKNLSFVVNKKDHVMFLGDGDKLARAFSNLLKNAINYCYENSQIQVSLTETEDKIEIVFKNEGDKIPKYKLEKIFDKFYRLDESRSTQTGGTGLGLAITKEIINLHGGTIYAKNDTDLIEFYIELKKCLE